MEVQCCNTKNKSVTSLVQKSHPETIMLFSEQKKSLNFFKITSQFHATSWKLGLKK